MKGINSSTIISCLQKFNFNLSALDWPTYMHHYCKGTKLHVMKEKDSTLKKSQSHINK